jgi:hypothetical protein
MMLLEAGGLVLSIASKRVPAFSFDRFFCIANPTFIRPDRQSTDQLLLDGLGATDVSWDWRPVMVQLFMHCTLRIQSKG